MHKGSCQCGQLNYQLIKPPLTCYTCHCHGCQTSTGSAFTMSMIIKDDAIQFDGGNLSNVDYVQNGNNVRRHFCPQCATTIYFSAPEFPEFIALKPGTFDNNDWYQPIAHLWLSSAQPWVKLEDDLPQYDEQPEMHVLFDLWDNRLKR